MGMLHLNSSSNYLMSQVKKIGYLGPYSCELERTVFYNMVHVVLQQFPQHVQFLKHPGTLKHQQH